MSIHSHLWLGSSTLFGIMLFKRALIHRILASRSLSVLPWVTLAIAIVKNFRTILVDQFLKWLFSKLKCLMLLLYSEALSVSLNLWYLTRNMPSVMMHWGYIFKISWLKLAYNFQRIGRLIPGVWDFNLQILIQSCKNLSVWKQLIYQRNRVSLNLLFGLQRDTCAFSVVFIVCLQIYVWQWVNKWWCSSSHIG